MTKHTLFRTLFFTLLLTLTTTATFLIRLIWHLRRAKYPPPASLIVIPPLDASVERQENDDLLIRWRINSDSVRIYKGTDGIRQESLLVEVSGKKEALISGLAPRSRYYFELCFEGGEGDGQRIVVSEAILALQGASNLRDLGGYRTDDGRRTKWGLIYRSSELSTLTDDDFEYLLNLGIKQVCDLRTRQEIERRANRLPKELIALHKPIYKELPVGGWDFILNLHRLEETWLRGYTEHIIDQKAQAFGDLLRFLADANHLPIVIHCTAGKDRTGVLLALLLLALGVPEETVIADYSLSNLYYETLRQKMESDMMPLYRLKLTDKHLQPIFVANPAIMQATLKHIKDKYGSVMAYLRDAAGVEDEIIERLRTNLLQ